MAPPPCEFLGCVIAAGLLLADFVHKIAPGNVPEGEAGPLLDGDLLVVTHSVGETVDRLRSLKLGDETLQEYWFVDSYSRYFNSGGAKARVFVANPGWVLDGIPSRRICGIVIDATHPRTLSKVPQLLEKVPSKQLQIVVSSPLLKNELSDMGYPEKAKLWLWDPEAKNKVDEIISSSSTSLPYSPKRSIWICKDSELDDILAGVHDLLAGCKSLADNPSFSVREAWSIYHRLRQFTVPLAQYEDSTFKVWGSMPLKKRLERLRTEWPNTVSVEVRWPGILQGLEKAYEIIKKQDYPSKFYAIAERAQEHLKRGSESLRIVVPTEHETTILNLNMNILLGGWLKAQKEERVEVVSVKEEARRVSMGEAKTTLLVGTRVGAQRYLDVYPSFNTEVIAYPYEADLDLVYQDRLYEFVEGIQDDRKRTEMLVDLGLKAGSGESSGKSTRPKVEIAGSVETRVQKSRIIMPDPKALDLDRLVGSGIPASWDEDVHVDPDNREAAGRRSGREVFVTFTNGRKATYMEWQTVDVYHPGTGDTRRYKASELLPGMRVILLVDSNYDSLFDRLLEALQARLGVYTKMILELWEQAKAAVLRSHNYNRADIYNTLYRKGLQIEYSAMLAWFRMEQHSPQLELGFSFSSSGSQLPEAIGPQKFSNMKIVAEHSGMYPDENMIRETFAAIEEERQRRRKAGKALHRLLRAIASGTGYDKALEEARKLDAKVADVLAAVDVQEIGDVRVAGEQPTIVH